MSRFSPGSPPVTTLAAAITDTATTLTVPSGSHTAMDRPERVILGSAELVDVLSVATGSPETWTVTRAVGTTVAQGHDVGTVVERVYTLTEVIYNPRVAAVTIPTGTSTYTPDAGIKYHHLTLGGSTTLAIGAPTGTVEPGDELRFTFQITQTALSTQPTWHACYRRYNQGTATQGTVTLTKDTLTGFSFFYRGGGIAAAAAWVRQH